MLNPVGGNRLGKRDEDASNPWTLTPTERTLTPQWGQELCKVHLCQNQKNPEVQIRLHPGVGKVRYDNFLFPVSYQQ